MKFLVSFLLGALYSALIGLISYLWSFLVAWPGITLLLWISFRKLNLLRVAGYLAILPVSVLGFEIVRTIINPSVYAYRYLSLDRSHYIPGIRIAGSKTNVVADPDAYGREGEDILIGKDGFRADPDSGKGNPERCQMALVGDSMIYGSGLSYQDTLRPVLAAMGVDACVFGVTGNAPTDYLSTLTYVAKRIEKEAHIAIYLYAYNDFVTLNKHFRRRFRALFGSFDPVAGLIAYIDDWRQTTFIYGLFRKKRPPSLSQWQIKLGEKKPVNFWSPHDPARYTPPSPLNRGKRTSLKFFIQELNKVARDRSWHVSIVIIPDNVEFVANLASQSVTFQNLDPRRADALGICRTFPFGCEDLTSYLYERTLAEEKYPYLVNDRHLSAFGTQVVAEHFLAATKRRLSGSAANFSRVTSEIQSKK